MNKILSLILLLLAPICALAQENPRASQLSAKEAEPVLANVLRSYLPWSSAEFQGSLKLDQLPVSPSLKIYMEKGTLLQVSVRVPILGEMARLHLSPSELLIVNKHNKTFVREDASNLIDLYPGAISDLQSILLARVVIFGRGELAVEHFRAVSVAKGDAESWIVWPGSEEELSGVDYMYSVGASGRTQSLIVTLQQMKTTLFADYSYKNRGEQIKFRVQRPGKSDQNATLNFESVKWGGTRMAEPSLKGYKKVSLTEFIKSI